MLILSRKVGEAVIVDEKVAVRLLEIKGGQIKLGIEAPNSVGIHREEVFLRIVEENKKAASSSQPADLAGLSRFIQK
jgi:carbon storage regulator